MSRYTQKQQKRAEPEGFARFWDAYPKRVARLDAAKAWAQLNPSPALVEEMLSAVEQQKQLPSWRKDDGQYIPYPASWIRAERWTDEYEVERPRQHIYWADECQELHGGSCIKRWDHEMKKRDVA